MENTLNIDGQIFYLCRVKGLLKEPKNSGTGLKYAGMFAYLKPELGEIPQALIGVTQDKDGKYLPVAIHKDMVDAVHEAFMTNSLVLIRIEKLELYDASVVKAVLNINSSLVFVNDFFDD